MRTDPKLELAPGDVALPGLPGRDFADGVSQSGKEPNRLFLSREGSTFVDASGVSGLDHEGDGRAFAWLDVDRDGWRDVALVSANAPLLQVFRNRLGDGPVGARGRQIAIRFEGANRTARPAPGKSARDGYGARVEVNLGGVSLVREHRAGEGLAAQNSAILLVGIGARDEARSITVHWPSGTTQTFERVAAGTLLHAVEDGEGPGRRTPYRPIGPADGDGGDVAGTEDPTPEDPPRLLAELPDTASLRVLTTLATWCEACTEELPDLALLRERFGDDELALYGVPVDPEDTQAKLGAWVRSRRPPYRVLHDLPADRAAGVRSHVEATLRRDALPASIITDGEGRVLRTLWGAPTVSDIVRLRPAAMAEFPHPDEG